MNKKYHIDLNDYIEFDDGITLYRIISDRAISNIVQKGDIGGYIESYDNLDQSGDAWVFTDAMVYGNARITGNAMIKDNTKIYDNAFIYDNAHIEGCSEVCGKSKIYGNAIVRNSHVRGSIVSGNAGVLASTIEFDSTITGNTFIHDFAKLINTKVSGNITIRRSNISSSVIKHSAEVYFSDIHNANVQNGTELINADIRGDNDIAFVSGFGRENRNTTFYRSKDGYLMVICGCFYGIINEFENQVRETYIEEDGKMNPLGDEYMDIAKLMRKRFERIGVKTDNNEESLVDILYESKKSDKSHPEEDGGKEVLYLDFSSTE